MSRLTNMNKGASEVVDKKFTSLLLEGNWKECEYKKTEFGHSYSMIAYATKRAQYCKAVQNKLVEKGYEYGLWQNLRNQKYMDVVNDVVQALTVEEVDNSERFQTMWG